MARNTVQVADHQIRRDGGCGAEKRGETTKDDAKKSHGLLTVAPDIYQRR